MKVSGQHLHIYHAFWFAALSLTLLVATLQLLDSSLNVLHATLLAHLLSREVGVETGTVPVTGDGLRSQRDASTEDLGGAAIGMSAHNSLNSS